MRGNLNIPEIEKEQEIREKYIKKFEKLIRDLLVPPLDLPDITIRQFAEMIMFRCDPYAQEKIDNIFAQKANRNKGSC